MSKIPKIFQSKPEFPTTRQLDHRDFKEERSSYWMTDGKGGRVTFSDKHEMAMDWDEVFPRKKLLSEEEAIELSEKQDL